MLKGNLVRLPAAVERAISDAQGTRARKAAEDALRVSEERYRTLVAASSQLVWTTDAQGNVVDDSPGWRAFTGLTLEEIQGDGWAAALHPDDLKQTMEVWSRAVGARTLYATEFRVRRADGEYRHLTVRGVPVLNEDGTVREWIGTYTDVTERIRAEAQIHEDEAKFRSLVEQNVAGIFIIREDGTIGYVNPFFADLLGYPASGLIGHPLLDIIPEDEKAGVREKLVPQLSGDVEFVEHRLTMPTRDRRPIDLLVNASRSIFEGRPAVLAVVLDVTETNKSARELAFNAAVLATEHEVSPDGILVVDPQGQMISFNRRFVDMWGLSDEIIASKSDARAMESVLPTLEDPEHMRQTARRLYGHPEEKLRDEIALIDGRTFDRYSAPMPKPDGGYLGRVFYFRDITERKATERTLLRLNRTLKTLSRGNMALVQADSEATLLTEMCHVIVDTGGYRMAWIGEPQQDAAKTVIPVAWAGEIGQYLEKAQITWADEPRGRGPHGRAIRSGEPQVTQNLGADPRMTPWRQAAKESGFGASVVLPLKAATGVFAALMIYSADTDAFDTDELKLLQELADDLAFGIRSLREHTAREAMDKRWRTSLEATVGAIASTVEMRDPYTAGHQQRVARLGVAIARELDLPEQQIEGLYLAGIVHDVGKIDIPAEILNKPGKLSKLQYQMLQGHAEAGYDILKGVDFPWPIAQMVRQHHERLDGSGYPQGLKGDAILAEARILAVADVVEAMMSHRPYRPSLGIDAALAEIEEGKGRLFDTAAVEACVALFRHKEFSFE